MTPPRPSGPPSKPDYGEHGLAHLHSSGRRERTHCIISSGSHAGYAVADCLAVSASFHLDVAYRVSGVVIEERAVAVAVDVTDVADVDRFAVIALFYHLGVAPDCCCDCESTVVASCSSCD